VGSGLLDFLKGMVKGLELKKVNDLKTNDV
jgi:hypothetical protein